jgi:6-phosphogluconolactonase
MRSFLFLLFFQVIVFQSLMAQNQLVIIGTYTQKGSEGVYLYNFNPKNGQLSPLSITKNLVNPSFLAISPNRKFVYVVEETSNGKVNAFRLDEKKGELTLLNTKLVKGDDPCHIEVDKTGKWVLVGNYSSGNLSVFPVQTDGSLGEAQQVIQHEGKSINPDRQEKPHVHSVNISPNNQEVLVVDLGIDKVMAYQFNSDSGKLNPASPAFTEVQPGAGPRHFAFHPNGQWAYVILELNSSITAFTYEKGKLNPQQTISTLPSDFKENNSCADIHVSPDGKFLYASNRGHNSLVVYRINPRNGQLTLVQHQSVMGDTPRNFAISPDGKFVLVANQNSDNITVFKRNKQNGKLTYTQQSIRISMPVCIKF